MFRTSETTRQAGLWSGNAGAIGLGERSRKIYESADGWHNEFRREVTDRIDESVFKPLFNEKTGAPNSPIRVMVAMMALKDGEGVSDSRLFDDARFNLLTRSALGLINIDDEAPTESTYYLFRQKIAEYDAAHKDDLCAKAFAKVTRAQCLEYNVKGKKVRMDSKLMGSNIAILSRYQIIHETIRKYIAGALLAPAKLTEDEKKLLKAIMEETGSAATYTRTKDEIEKRLGELGRLIYWMLKEKGAEKNPDYELLKRVYNDNYDEVEGPGGGKQKTVVPKEKAAISAKSVQNPHDPDAEFRDKGSQKVKGYSHNITETCDENSLNLIVDVQTEGAGKADVDFFEAALEGAKEMVTEKIEQAHTDGAFHSPGNQAYCKKNDIDFVLGKITGKPSKYDLSFDDEGNLKVVNTETGENLPAVKTSDGADGKPERWRVKDGKNAPLYFERKHVEVCEVRKKLATRSKEELNLRNNVEATMLQLGYHYRHDKSRYRGLIKHRMWAISRCLWINFRRIAKWNAKKRAEAASQSRQLLSFFRLYFCRPLFTFQFA